MLEDLNLNSDTFEIFYHEDGGTSTGTTSSSDTVGAVTGAVSSVAQLGGAIAQNRANKQASKSDLTQSIESQCGKRSRFLSKKKKQAYQSCAQSVTDKYNKQVSASAPRPTYVTPVVKKQDPNKNLKTGLIVGGILLTLGILVYLRLGTKGTPIATPTV